MIAFALPGTFRGKIMFIAGCVLFHVWRKLGDNLCSAAYALDGDVNAL
jgi:hypothetical protein